MAPKHKNSSNLEQLALKRLTREYNEDYIYNGCHFTRLISTVALCLQFTMFDTSMTNEDSFTELSSGTTMTSLPVPASLQIGSPKSSLAESTRSHVSRTLTFDEGATPPGRHSGPRSAARPSLIARRRSHRFQAVDDRLPRSSSAVHDDFSPVPSCAGMPSPIISGCIEENDERADLIGDLTAKHVLPLECDSKHADLKTISPRTVSVDIGAF